MRLITISLCTLAFAAALAAGPALAQSDLEVKQSGTTRVEPSPAGPGPTQPALEVKQSGTTRVEPSPAGPAQARSDLEVKQSGTTRVETSPGGTVATFNTEAEARTACTGSGGRFSNRAGRMTCTDPGPQYANRIHGALEVKQSGTTRVETRPRGSFSPVRPSTPATAAPSPTATTPR